MLFQVVVMAAGNDDQTSVFAIDLLHRRPRANDAIGRTKWKVVKILVQRVSRTLSARIGRFVDQLKRTNRIGRSASFRFYHRVHRHDIRAGEILHVLDDFRQTTVFEQFIVQSEILNLRDRFFSVGKFRFGDGHVFHHRHAQDLHFAQTNVLKTLSKAIQRFRRDQIPDD